MKEHRYEGSISRATGENVLHNSRGRVSGLERQRQHLASGGFHFLASGNEVGPVGAFDQDIRQHGSDQLTRRVLVKEGHYVDSRERGGQLRSLILRNERTRGAFQPLYAGVGI